LIRSGGFADDPCVEFAERAAQNEEIFRGVNERIDSGTQRHHVTTPTAFHCECGSASCASKIDLEPHEYERVARERYRFIVIPGHEDNRIECVVEEQSRYLVVEKIGEAREQIDRDHPQRRHRS
jgi:hypothetical protein